MSDNPFEGLDLPVLERRLPDGRLLVVQPLTFGKGRLAIGDGHWLDDEW